MSSIGSEIIRYNGSVVWASLLRAWIYIFQGSQASLRLDRSNFVKHRCFTLCVLLSFLCRFSFRILALRPSQHVVLQQWPTKGAAVLLVGHPSHLLAGRWIRSMWMTVVGATPWSRSLNAELRSVWRTLAASTSSVAYIARNADVSPSDRNFRRQSGRHSRPPRKRSTKQLLSLKPKSKRKAWKTMTFKLP